jgi:hypothetical protein
MIWTVHFGYDNRGWPSFERAAHLVNDTGIVHVQKAPFEGVGEVNFAPSINQKLMYYPLFYKNLRKGV